MPRGRKCRRVCFEPENTIFEAKTGVGEILITMEEFEAIRLADFEELDQSQAAIHMNVSRGTFQRILYTAHFKVAEALCLGKSIRIEGGNYELSTECPKNRRCMGCCQKNQNHRGFTPISPQGLCP